MWRTALGMSLQVDTKRECRSNLNMTQEKVPRDEQREISLRREEAPGGTGVEPDVGRVANGIPGRVHRLKGLGNSIIPKIAEEIGKAIIGAYNGSR
jgi:hypothetical protein